MVLQVSCSCGARAAVDTGAFGRPITCRRCRARRVAVWGIDPKSKKAAPTTFEASPSEPRGFKIPFGVSELPCPCGGRMYARAREAGKRVQCPACATWLKLEHGKDPQTLETRIRVVKSRLNQLPELPPEPDPQAASDVHEILCSCGETLRIDPAASGNQAQCPSCTTSMRLEVQKDSEPTCIVVDPDPAKKPKVPEKRGIDEELSLDDFK